MRAPASERREEPPPAVEVTVQDATGRADPETEALVRWLRELVAAVAPETDSFCLRLSEDREVQRLNRDYRDKDRATDVLSFPGSVSPEGRHLGDVVISVRTAARQAETAGHSLAHELRLLALHGLLHCLGYDHETDDGQMERLEARLRRRWPAADA